MSLRAMPPWLYRGGQDDYQFNDLVKPEDLQKLPPLDNDEVSWNKIGEIRCFLFILTVVVYFILVLNWPS